MIKIIHPNEVNITFNNKSIFIVTSNKNLFDTKLEKFEYSCECYIIESQVYFIDDIIKNNHNFTKKDNIFSVSFYGTQEDELKYILGINNLDLFEEVEKVVKNVNKYFLENILNKKRK